MTDQKQSLDVGFIGLGTMGGRIAENLLKAGYRLRVWNRTRTTVDRLTSLGARGVATAREAFAGDVVFSMLADDNADREVIEPLLDGAPKGLVHGNLSTISVPMARELAERHRANGLAYVACPVFGRPELASAAKLTIVAGGDPSAVNRVEPLLSVIGERTWVIGAQPEWANVVKLAGNFMLGAAIEAMAEATAMASRFGVPPGDLIEILTQGVFTAPAYQMYGALIARQRYEPVGFRLSLLLKDLRLALAAADATNAPMPLASTVHDALLEAAAQGFADRDAAALGVVAMHRIGVDGHGPPSATAGI